MIWCSSVLGLLTSRLEGFHWRSPVRSWPACYGSNSHNAGETPTTTDQFGVLGQAVGNDGTLLG